MQSEKGGGPRARGRAARERIGSRWWRRTKWERGGKGMEVVIVSKVKR